MELIIQILMLFILINCALKISFWKPWQTVIFGLVAAAFIVLAYPYAIEQSKTQLDDYMSNTKMMQNMAVLITIESVLCFAFCFAALRQMFGKKIKRWVLPLYWYPGLLIFPVLFYVLTQSMFHLTGVDFEVISYLLAGIVLVIFPLLSLVMRYLLPEKELRLEVHFLVSLFICILGLITTVDGNVTYQAAADTTNYKVLLYTFLLFAVMFIIGWGWNKVKWRISKKKNQTK